MPAILQPTLAHEMLKPALKKIAVFGANARIGGGVARALQRYSKDTPLRLIAHNEAKIADLKTQFPDAEYAVADYYDADSLRPAIGDADGVFVVTPPWLDEERGMRNLVHALRQKPILVKHVVRMLGMTAETKMETIPDVLRNSPSGTAIQHLLGKAELEKGRIPITFVNVGAYFMQNFSGPLYSIGVRKYKTLCVPRDRRMGFIDTEDIGKACASVLLSTDHRHIGKTYHLDNGNDAMLFSDVAKLMTEVWGEEIKYDGSDEAFVNLKYTGEIDTPPDPPLAAEDPFITYSQFEQDHQTVWRLSDIFEFLTGEKAKTLRQWLKENKATVFESTDIPIVHI